MNNIKIFLATLFAAMACAVPVFAQSTEVTAEEPAWFFLLEVFGIIVAIVTVVTMTRAGSIAKGGLLEKVFNTFRWGLVAIAVSLIMRSISEWVGTETFLLNLAFELLLYIGLIFMLAGTLKAQRALTVPKE